MPESDACVSVFLILQAGGPCAVDRSLLTDPHFRLGLPAPSSHILKICYAREGALSKFISAHKSGKFGYASEGALSKFISAHKSGKFGYASEGALSKFISAHKSGKFGYASEGALSKFISAHKSGKFGYASEGALSKFISSHLSTDAVRAPLKVCVLIRP